MFGELYPMEGRNEYICSSNLGLLSWMKQQHVEFAHPSQSWEAFL